MLTPHFWKSEQSRFLSSMIWTSAIACSLLVFFSLPGFAESDRSLLAFASFVVAGFLGIANLLVLPIIRFSKRESDQGTPETTRLKQLALISEKTTNLAIFTDPFCRIVWVNESFTRVTGYTLKEVIGRVPGQFLQCEDTCPKTVERMRFPLPSMLLLF